jgi:HlyD family secretion protein
MKSDSLTSVSLIVICALLLVCCAGSTKEVKPVRQQITETVFASGTIEASEEWTLASQTDGYISAFHMDENSIVQPGTVVAEIANRPNRISARSASLLYKIAEQDLQPGAPSLEEAKTRIEAAKAKVTFDSAQEARYAALLHENTIAPATYQSIKLQLTNSRAEYASAVKNYEVIVRKAREQLIVNRSQNEINNVVSEYNKVRTSGSGIVLKKFKREGDFVQRGEAIALVGNVDSVYARVNVDENSIGRVKIGQQVAIALNTEKDKVYKGRVASIQPLFDEETQSFVVEISFDEQPLLRFAGTQLQVNIVTEVIPDALVIPRRYVNYANEVRVKGADEPVKITTSFVSSDWVRVLSGIDEQSVLLPVDRMAP